MYPRSNCIPSTTSSCVSIVLDSSTVMTPSLPTFFMASAMMPPICLSLFALIVPTCAIMSPLTSLWSFLTSSTATSTARSMPRLRAVGLAPAATVFTPSRKMACASTVAVVVPSPATSDVLEATSRTICAPIFSSESFNSISFATVTPSLVMTGAPNFFSITALRPFGPRVILTASANRLTPRKMDWRECSPVTICFAAMTIVPPYDFSGTFFRPPRRLSLARKRKELSFPGSCFGRPPHLSEDLIFAKNQVIFVFNLDFSAGVLAEQNAIANFNVQGNSLALVQFACADGYDLPLLRFLFSRVGHDDATLHGLLLLDTLDHESIVERLQSNCHFSRTSFVLYPQIRIKTSASCKRKFTSRPQRIICPRKQRQNCSHMAMHFRMAELRLSHVRLDASGASPDPCVSAHSAEMDVCCLHWRRNECGKDDFL